MRFERFSEPLLPFNCWLRRMIKSIGLAVAITGTALLIGIIGYHLLGKLGWVDSILEASMILGGMGPVATMQNDPVKLFASAYALFSGLVVLSTMGIILGPWLHRVMHHWSRSDEHNAVVIKEKQPKPKPKKPHH